MLLSCIILYHLKQNYGNMDGMKQKEIEQIAKSLLFSGCDAEELERRLAAEKPLLQSFATGA